MDSSSTIRQPRDPTPRRHLALWFPFLPCERVRPVADGGPLALVQRQGHALRLTAVCPRAARLGLAVGMPLANARARHPELVTQPHDEAADADELERLATRMLHFTPLVTPDPPDGLLLDISGCAHLWGGEQALLAALRAGVDYTLRAALADHAAAARALVRYGDGEQDVRSLPVAALELGEEATRGLVRAGLGTIGDLAARPMAGLAARFGPQSVVALRRLLGDEAAPLDPLTPAAPLRFERRFAEPVALQASIAACFTDLLRKAARALERRALGGRAFRLTLHRSDGARQRLEITTGQPTRDPAAVLRLFNERIAALADPLDPGFGYDRITLFLPVAEPLPASQPALDRDEPEPAALAELIDRLSTRLGPECITRLAPRDSHIPERSQRALPAIHTPAIHAPAIRRQASAHWPAPIAGEPPPRPPILFDPPQPVTAMASVPDGPPLRFRWRESLHEVVLAEGPERIAPEWWRYGNGHLAGQGLTRDYYRVEDAAGRRFWLFRHGLYEECGQPRWYLHGLFA